MQLRLPKFSFFILLLVTLPLCFYSCYWSLNSKTQADIDSHKGLTFQFADTTLINRIDFVGSGRYKEFNSQTARVTLNPADTVCSFEIHYNEDSGMVIIKYKPRVEYDDKGEIKVIQEATIDYTSFRSAVFLNGYYNERQTIPTIQITR